MTPLRAGFSDFLFVWRILQLRESSIGQPARIGTGFHYSFCSRSGTRHRRLTVPGFPPECNARGSQPVTNSLSDPFALHFAGIQFRSTGSGASPIGNKTRSGINFRTTRHRSWEGTYFDGRTTRNPGNTKPGPKGVTRRSLAYSSPAIRSVLFFETQGT